MFGANSIKVDRVWHSCLNGIFPPICYLCQTDVDDRDGICAKCWGKLTFVTKPFCRVCGFPFEIHPPEGDAFLCGHCMTNPKPYVSGRTILAYDAVSRLLILPYKHLDRTELTPILIRLFLQVGEDWLKNIDLIVPVPLHYRRLLLRKYNQAALLTSALSKEIGAINAPDLLKRKRATVSQGGLTAIQRRANVTGSFIISPNWKAQLQNKRVLLIDDVMTTGATVEACCDCLNKAGAGEVKVLTLARVLRPSNAR